MKEAFGYIQESIRQLEKAMPAFKETLEKEKAKLSEKDKKKLEEVLKNSGIDEKMKQFEQEKTRLFKLAKERDLM